MEAKSHSYTPYGVNYNNRLRVSSTGVAVEEFSPNDFSIRLNFGTPSLSWSVVWWSSLNHAGGQLAFGRQLVNDNSRFS
ncbi:MAG: hypothetical protein HY276_00240 [Ignavibacteriales bacterium]|nr:hypothetical protein [Ignavibacteriales bacterium]MBI3786664.1 hypothetical protein [Ignavibacteriales bacterium]